MITKSHPFTRVMFIVKGYEICLWLEYDVSKVPKLSYACWLSDYNVSLIKCLPFNEIHKIFNCERGHSIETGIHIQFKQNIMNSE